MIFVLSNSKKISNTIFGSRWFHPVMAIVYLSYRDYFILTVATDVWLIFFRWVGSTTNQRNSWLISSKICINQKDADAETCRLLNLAATVAIRHLSTVVFWTHFLRVHQTTILWIKSSNMQVRLGSLGIYTYYHILGQGRWMLDSSFFDPLALFETWRIILFGR